MKDFGFWGMTFANPWLLALLAIIPLLSYLRGQRGGVPAIAYSSTSIVRALGRHRQGQERHDLGERALRCFDKHWQISTRVREAVRFVSSRTVTVSAKNTANLCAGDFRQRRFRSILNCARNDRTSPAASPLCFIWETPARRRDT